MVFLICRDEQMNQFKQVIVKKENQPPQHIFDRNATPKKEFVRSKIKKSKLTWNKEPQQIQKQLTNENEYIQDASEISAGEYERQQNYDLYKKSKQLEIQQIYEQSKEQTKLESERISMFNQDFENLHHQNGHSLNVEQEEEEDVRSDSMDQFFHYSQLEDQQVQEFKKSKSLLKQYQAQQIHN